MLTLHLIYILCGWAGRVKKRDLLLLFWVGNECSLSLKPCLAYLLCCLEQWNRWWGCSKASTLRLLSTAAYSSNLWITSYQILSMCEVKERLNPGPGQKQPSAKRLPSTDHTEVRSRPHKPGPRRTASERYAFYPSVWLAGSVLLSPLPPSTLHPPLLPLLFDQSDSTTMNWRFIGTQRLQ